ncbi:hypothetical protein BHM03_00057446 [Ensete ventricosum]|nr:hypothetical protein BHM03_00057446 [Ensete ventricosum]
MQRNPKLLCASVETVLKPRMRSLQDMGFSDTEIVQLIISSPGLLYFRDIQPRINFWRSLLGSNERLIKASRRTSLEKRLRPRYEVVNFLEQNKLLDKEHGLLSVMLHSEEKFGKKFLFLLREEKFIARYDSYVAAVQGKHPDVAEN